MTTPHDYITFFCQGPDGRIYRHVAARDAKHAFIDRVPDRVTREALASSRHKTKAEAAAAPMPTRKD